MWVDWIRRAYDGGLRVIVALAVNSKTLGDMTAGPGDYATDDKSSADRQIKETKDFVARHDFMEVAYSAADLERIVRANKLAVVLGIEVDNIGNLHTVRPLKNAQISAEITRLYAEGVRYIFPIHLVDNPFGGTAAYLDTFNYSNYHLTGRFWDLRCSNPADSIDYAFNPMSKDFFAVAGLAVKLNLDMAFRNPPNYPKCAKGTGQVNKRGLTPEGIFALKEMMRRGMLIDIDHMSQESANQALQAAEAVPGGYPLNSGHNGLRSHNERAFTAAQYARIAKLHGMAGVGSADTDAYMWIQEYDRVIKAMGNNAVAGFGTDTNGLAIGMPHRRGSQVRYDKSFPKSSLGTKSWDYNTDGVVHYGMLADFLKDARTAPGGANLIDNNLMSGAEYFGQTWQKCESLKGSVK